MTKPQDLQSPVADIHITVKRKGDTLLASIQGSFSRQDALAAACAALITSGLRNDSRFLERIMPHLVEHLDQSEIPLETLH